MNEQLTKDQEENLWSWCIYSGVNLEYGKLSLCDLRNFNHSAISTNRRYQVHSDDHYYPCSMIYDELRPAVLKFMELKKKVKRVK